MWKTLGSELLRFGAVYCLFGVFGVAFVFLRLFRLGWRSSDDQGTDSQA